MPDEIPQDGDQLIDIPEEEFEAAVSPPDCKGRINLRLSQALEQEIQDIAHDSRYPLHSPSEVVRFCCHMGLERLRQWKPRATLLSAIKAANAVCMRDKIQCELLEVLDRMDERVDWYIAHKEYDEALSFAAQIHSYFDAVGDDFWRRYMQNAIDMRVSKWMAQIDKAREGY